jgi:hypothetical protein
MMRVNQQPAAHQVEDGVHHLPLQLLLLQVLVHRERHVQVEEVGGHVPEAGGRQPTGFLVPQIDRQVAGVLDEPHSQVNPLSGVAVQGSQSTVQSLKPCPSFICSLAGQYGYSGERA